MSTTHLTSDGILRSGFLAALPIVLGYLPISFAFGVAGAAHDMSYSSVIAMSVLVFAGASQFVLLTTLASGGSWLLVIGLCTLMDFRHIFYGTILKDKIPFSTGKRFIAAFFMTDEVFATALVKSGSIEETQREKWVLVLGLVAYLSWVVATCLGIYLGNEISSAFPLTMQVMLFSLPALFLLLSYECLNRDNVLSLFVAAIVSATCLLLHWHNLTLVLGGLSGALVGFLHNGKGDDDGQILKPTDTGPDNMSF